MFWIGLTICFMGFVIWTLSSRELNKWRIMNHDKLTNTLTLEEE